MDFLKNINESTIIITTKNNKPILLEEINKIDKILDIKIITTKELKNKYLFSYNEQTILYLMNKYNLKYTVALIYLENLYYIENKKYDSDKLNFLVKIKQELINNNLLIFDNNYKEYLKNKKIIVYKIKNLNKLEQTIINELQNVTIIEENTKLYKHKIYKFTTLEEEVEFVAKKISELINNNIPINNIKITNLDNDYTNSIQRIFKLFNLTLEEENNSLYSYDITKDFLNNYKENINETLEYIKEKYNITKENKIYNEIVNIINAFAWTDNYLKVKPLIEQKLKDTKYIKPKQKNSIKIIDYLNDYIEDNDYVFMLNFNQNSIPKIYKDEDYITDNLKKYINIETTIEKNKLQKENTIKSINNIKNLTITYKEKTNTKTYYPSILIKELNLEEQEIKDNNISYSCLNDKINLTKYLDNYIKYNIKTNKLEKLLYNYNNINYLSYNNEYNKINKQEFLEYINNKLYLSYTSIDTYYKCAFKYYLTNILKLEPYEETFSTIIGKVFHYILEKSLNNDIDIQKEINVYLENNNITFTNKERFFFNKLTKDLNNLVEKIKKQLEFTKLKDALYEQKIIINKQEDIEVSITGIIDKVMYKKQQDKTIVSLIDYKTGTIDLNLDYIKNGLGLQLPMYLYLIKNSNLIENPLFAGFYLQKILKEKEENYKLEGYSNIDEDIIKEFDISYKDSEIIKGLKVKNDGNFYSTAKVLTNTQIEEIISLVEDNINKAIYNIKNCNFEINPKKIENITNISCKYCTMNDICFMKEKNIEIIKKEAGEENA